MRTGLRLMVLRSLRQHALASSLTILSLGLGFGLVTSVAVLSERSRDAFNGQSFPFDAVLGVRGSPLQLVLNSLFQLDTSPGNMPWVRYLELSDDPSLRHAAPIAVGDHLSGFRVVGTSPAFFDCLAEHRAGAPLLWPGGRRFDPTRREAVLGHSTARRLSLAPGDVIHPSHGVQEHAGEEHDEDFVVVGILRPTGSPFDRVVWIPIEAVFRMQGHELRGSGEPFHAKPGEPIPEQHKELSAVLLKLRSAADGFALSERIQHQQQNLTLAWPVGRVLADLFDKLSWVSQAFALLAALVVVVAAASMLAALTNTMSSRRRDLAILRALGARRRTLFASLLLESMTLAGLGSLVGLLVHALILGAVRTLLESRTGVVLEVWEPHISLALAPPAALALGALAGLLPALQAYRTDVASQLAPTA